MRTFLILVFLAAPLHACLWDTDTLAQESAGMGDIKTVIVGGFPRNPSLYYEMRLTRVTALLASEPDNLDAYDDAAVACDRLQKQDEAIEWMARKAAAMERLKYDPEAHSQPNHRYRYLANLGTFHVHRWFGAGVNWKEMADVEKARELIRQAIDENPEAHFGREKYQLMAIEWLLSKPTYYANEADAPDGRIYEVLPDFLGLLERGMFGHTTSDDGRLKAVGLGDAVEGTAGLIRLGAAWGSVDVFYALALALQNEGKSSLAAMASARVAELIADGRKSIVRGAPTGNELIEFLSLNEGDLLRPGQFRDVRAHFDSLRIRSDAWQASRTKYLTDRLEEGRHPDTLPEFWADFEGDSQIMGLLEPNSIEVWWDDLAFPENIRLFLIVLGLLFVLAIIAVLRRRSRRIKKALT